MQQRDRARFFSICWRQRLERGQAVEPGHPFRRRQPAEAWPWACVSTSWPHRLRTVPSSVRRWRKPPTSSRRKVNAMLQAGEKLGDLKKVLPACREVLRIAPNALRHRDPLHCVAILLIFAPVAIGLISLLTVFVIPKFKDVFAGMGVKLWNVTLLVFYLNDQHILIGFGGAAVPRTGDGHGILHWRAGPDAAFPIPQRSHCGLVCLAYCRGSAKNCSTPFPPYLRCCWTAACRKRRPSASQASCTANEICRRRTRRVLAALEDKREAR